MHKLIVLITVCLLGAACAQQEGPPTLQGQPAPEPLPTIATDPPVRTQAPRHWYGSVRITQWRDQYGAYGGVYVGGSSHHGGQKLPSRIERMGNTWIYIYNIGAVAETHGLVLRVSQDRRTLTYRWFANAGDNEQHTIQLPANKEPGRFSLPDPEHI